MSALAYVRFLNPVDESISNTSADDGDPFIKENCQTASVFPYRAGELYRCAHRCSQNQAYFRCKRQTKSVEEGQVQVKDRIVRGNNEGSRLSKSHCAVKLKHMERSADHRCYTLTKVMVSYVFVAGYLSRVSTKFTPLGGGGYSNCERSNPKKKPKKQQRSR